MILPRWILTPRICVDQITSSNLLGLDHKKRLVRADVIFVRVGVALNNAMTKTFDLEFIFKSVICLAPNRDICVVYATRLRVSSMILIYQQRDVQSHRRRGAEDEA